MFAAKSVAHGGMAVWRSCGGGVLRRGCASGAGGGADPFGGVLGDAGSWATHRRRPRLAFEQEPLKASDRLDFVKGEVRASVNWEAAPERLRPVVNLSLARLRRAVPLSDEAAAEEALLAALAAVPWGVRRGLDVGAVDLDVLREALEGVVPGQEVAKAELVEEIGAAVAVSSGDGRPLRVYPHLCLEGDTGVGKARLAKALADSLERPLHRIQAVDLATEMVGDAAAQSDVHPLTRCLITAGTMDPVIYIENVERLGDANPNVRQLAHLLHPHKGMLLRDEFLGIDIDISQVLFLFGYEDSGTQPLVDDIAQHLHGLPVFPWTAAQKLFTLRHSLLPDTARSLNIDVAHFDMDDETAQWLVSNFSPESGIDRLRQIVLRLGRAVLASAGRVDAITPAFVSKVVGRFHLDEPVERIGSRDLPPGVVASVSYREAAGGVIDYCEAALNPTKSVSHRDRLIQTGVVQSGTVQDSVEVAYSVARRLCAERGAPDAFEDKQVHVNWTDGPVDGTSAGINALIAMMSAATGRSVASGATVTGEISLAGNMLRVAGVPSKVLAASRAGFDMIVLPSANQVEFASWPESTVAGIEVKFVDTVEEALELLLPE